MKHFLLFSILVVLSSAAAAPAEAQQIEIATQAARVKHCVQSAFNGKRIFNLVRSDGSPWNWVSR